MRLNFLPVLFLICVIGPLMAQNPMLHMPRLVGDYDVSDHEHVITANIIDSDKSEDHRYTGIRNKEIMVDLEIPLSMDQFSLSFKIIPDQLEDEHSLFISENLEIYLKNGQVNFAWFGSEYEHIAELSKIHCNHIAFRVDNIQLSTFVNGSWETHLVELTGLEMDSFELPSYPGRTWDIILYDQPVSDEIIESYSEYCIINTQVTNPPFADFPDPICAAYVCLWAHDSLDLTEDKFQYYVQQQEWAYEQFIFEAGMYPHEDLEGFVDSRENRDLGMFEGIVQTFVNPWSFQDTHKRENANFWFHENYHSYQNNAGNFGTKWILESTAEWGSDMIFPGVTSTLLGYYSWFPHLPIWTIQDSPVDDYLGSEFKGGHQYGAYCFWSYITNMVSDDFFIGRMYNDPRVGPKPMEAVRDLLDEDGHDLKAVFGDFAAHTSVWDYADGTGMYFQDSEIKSQNRMMNAKPDAESFDNKIAVTMDYTGTQNEWWQIPEQLIPGCWAFNAIKVEHVQDSSLYTFKWRGSDQNSETSFFESRIIQERDGGFSYYDLPISQEAVFGNEEAQIQINALPGDHLFMVVSTVPDEYSTNFNLHYYYDFWVSFDIVSNVDQLDFNTIKIFPNPSSDYFQMEGIPSDKIESVQLINGAGKLVHQYEIDHSTNFQLPLLAPGQYYVRILTDEAKHYKKLVIQ